MQLCFLNVEKKLFSMALKQKRQEETSWEVECALIVDAKTFFKLDSL